MTGEEYIHAVTHLRHAVDAYEELLSFVSGYEAVDRTSPIRVLTLESGGVVSAEVWEQIRMELCTLRDLAKDELAHMLTKDIPND